MSVPILVLNCGSSSIRFAVFDAKVDPLPRKPLWSGHVEGIGGTSARLVEANAAPVPLSLDRERPYHAALQQPRTAVIHASTISSARSRVRVAVEPTNEEWIAASHAFGVIGRRASVASRHANATHVH